MANRLTMAQINAIETLHASGYSGRKITALLDVHRETVAKYVSALQNRPDHPAVGAPPTGSEVENGRSDPEIRPGPVSRCEPYRDVIQTKIEQGLTAQRIHQDLVADHGFTAKYPSIRRFVRRLAGTRELPVRRMEVLPGEEAQVDFGTGAFVKMPDGKRRRAWVFRIVLSHSRKAYSEAVWRQSTEAFLGALENAFRHFGGVPKTLVIDNLKAAVKKADWYDPEVHPKLQSFAAHDGTVFLPTKPYTPQHKGKIEAGVKYVKNNALKARTFASLEEQNTCLRDWERNVADTRIHGTTKRQVLKQQQFDFLEDHPGPTCGRCPLELVLQDELAVRYERLVDRRTRAAHFREQKTLEDFDWRFNPSVKRKQVFDLAAGEFVRRHRDVLLMGPPGVGKPRPMQYPSGDRGMRR